jgi:hypothetical protein
VINMPETVHNKKALIFIPSVGYVLKGVQCLIPHAQ